LEMKKVKMDFISEQTHLGCFGRFDMADPLCRHRCALRLRCAIERDHRHQVEIIEELLTAERFSDKFQ